ncbi:hypothetical protein BLS_008619 [Venturia inaequalis]|uniref:N-acetyltransferase domain-containing protein n=1 Tax=Venturia inaequalis TaxID=5025 RepID=A0A8H3UTC8_VENIN|nr:hypothetical protein EG328_003548 [Venturia inaequalis]KAE9980548.1 hypothetical protein BLS_008619 [Venturia inaequalis]RDI80798.1 hypothetical protein Vi05172_g9250 [Venturia inaequalis]
MAPSTESSNCIIRPATSLEEATNTWWPLMQTLGWNRARADSKTHYTSTTSLTGAPGFLVATSHSDPSKPQGCILPIVYTNKTGWVGFFCLNASVRGLGWGGKLFQAALDQFVKGSVEVVGLDAVQEQVGTYGRRGFVEMERGLVRLMGRPGMKEVPLKGTFEHVRGEGVRLVDLESVPVGVLVESDLACTGLERTGLWNREALFERSDAFGFALVSEGAKDELEGWVLVRGCEEGFRFGPLYANSKDNATLLLHQAMRRLEGKDGSFIAEVWPQNELACKVFEEAGWTNVGVDYHRMWLNGKVPAAQHPGGKADKEVYAIFDAGEG